LPFFRVCNRVFFGILEKKLKPKRTQNQVTMTSSGRIFVKKTELKTKKNPQ